MHTEELFGTPHPTGLGVRGGEPETRVQVSELLERVLELGASDLHLTAGASRRCGSTGTWASSGSTRC